VAIDERIKQASDQLHKWPLGYWLDKRTIGGTWSGRVQNGPQLWHPYRREYSRLSRLSPDAIALPSLRRRAAAHGKSKVSGWIPLFGSLTTGTLCGRWPDIGLWPIVLSLSDRHGVVDVTPMYLASITGLPQDDVIVCMKRFCEPDPYSRTETKGGARLVLIDEHRDWGWRIVNHGVYREKARKQQQQIDATSSGRDADRKRLERERMASGDVQRSPAGSSADRPSDSDSDSDKNKTKTAARRVVQTNTPAFHQEVIDAYHRICPHLPPIKTWPKHRGAKLNARIRERCSDGKATDTLEWWERFFESVAASDFLSGRTEPTRGRKPFKATIDWLLGPENFPKVIEEHYVTRSFNGAHAHG
jgi:hypothetical protein